MFSTDLGFAKEGRSLGPHGKELTEFEAWCLDSIAVYNSRTGNSGMPAVALADHLGIDDRALRKLINHLIDRKYHGQPIYYLAGAQGGYFLIGPDAPPELQDLRARSVGGQLSRAKTSARKARDMGATAQELTDGVVQLTLSLGEDIRRQVAKGLGKEKRRAPTHREITAQLRLYARDPAAFAAEIAEIRREFGGVFVRGEELKRHIRQQAEEMVTKIMAQLDGGA